MTNKNFLQLMTAIRNFLYGIDFKFATLFEKEQKIDTPEQRIRLVNRAINELYQTDSINTAQMIMLDLILKEYESED